MSSSCFRHVGIEINILKTHLWPQAVPILEEDGQILQQQQGKVTGHRDVHEEELYPDTLLKNLTGSQTGGKM